jgi:outer membrane protein TolC
VLAAIALTSLVWPGACAAPRLPAELADRVGDAAADLPSIADDDLVARVGADLVAGTLPPRAAVELPAECGPDDYVRLALARNPRLRKSVRAVEALAEAARQAGALPDPTLALGPPTGAMLQTAGGEMTGSLGVAQAIPGPGKRAARAAVAAEAVRAALEDLRAERDAVVAETHAAYAAFYLATVSIDVTNENQRLLERLRQVAEAKYAAGTAPQQDLLRAEVETYDVANRLISLGLERRAAAARLNALIDRDVLRELPPPVRVDVQRLELDLDALVARAVERNPTLAALRARGAGALAAVRLARLARRPDFSLSGMWTLISAMGLSPVADGADAFSLGIGISLPLQRGRIEAGILERNALLLAAAEHYLDAENAVKLAVVESATRVDAAARSALLLGHGILPRARQTVEVAESGYRSGQVDFLTLLSAWQRLLDLSLSHHAALASLEREVAALERVLGGVLAPRPDHGAAR